MSKYITNIETFDFSKNPEEDYSQKIEKIVKRYQIYDRDKRFREVKPRDPNVGESYFSIKFIASANSTQPETEIYCVYQERDLYVVGVLTKGVLYALSGSGLKASDFDDVEFQELHLGIRYDMLGEREVISITKGAICNSICTIGRGWTTPKKKLAIALLIMISSESAKFLVMKDFVQNALERNEYTQEELNICDRRLHVLQNNWDKLSKAIRSEKYPFVFSYKVEGILKYELVSRTAAGNILAILNHKGGSLDETNEGKNARRTKEGKGSERIGKKDRKKGKKWLRNLLEAALLSSCCVLGFLPPIVKWWREENFHNPHKLSPATLELCNTPAVLPTSSAKDCLDINVKISEGDYLARSSVMSVERIKQLKRYLESVKSMHVEYPTLTRAEVAGGTQVARKQAVSLMLLAESRNLSLSKSTATARMVQLMCGKVSGILATHVYPKVIGTRMEACNDGSSIFFRSTTGQGLKKSCIRFLLNLSARAATKLKGLPYK